MHGEPGLPATPEAGASPKRWPSNCSDVCLGNFGACQLPGSRILNTVHRAYCPHRRTKPNPCLLVSELTLKLTLPGNTSCLYLMPKIALHVLGAILAESAVKPGDKHCVFQVSLFSPFSLCILFPSLPSSPLLSPCLLPASPPILSFLTSKEMV